MSTVTDSEFAAHVIQLAMSAVPFEPTAIYDPDGDCIEFLVSPEPFYAERVDDLVTVYLSQQSGEVIGSLIKGVSGFREKILKTMPGFQIEIHDRRIRLVHLFRAQLWSSELNSKDVLCRTYKKLIEVAEESGAEAEMCLSS